MPWGLTYHPKAEGITVIRLRGWVISFPPACSTNSAGENELPWHTQTMLTSVLVYLYKNPVIVFPSGPFPVVETQGICEREGASSPLSLATFIEPGFGFWDFRGLSSGLGWVSESVCSTSLVELDLMALDGTALLVFLDVSQFAWVVSGWLEGTPCLHAYFNWDWSSLQWFEWLPASLLLLPPTKI